MLSQRGVNVMIGIYLITNKLNGHEYIGQSVNIKRRFMEHKALNAYGNDRLHNDIQRFGANNFSFEVLEECKKSELRDKELQYIHSRNPFYNFVGRKKTPETRKKISDGTRRWWNALSDSKKESIILNNLSGPRIGHKVSAETRQKISCKVSEIQRQKVRCLETGEIFESVGAFENSVGACGGTCAAYWRGRIKSVKGFHVEKCRD